MKSFVPHTQIERLRFILFPAKVYIVLTPVIFLLLNKFVHLDHHLDTDTRTWIMLAAYIYVACIIVLVLGAGFAALVARAWKVMWIALAYAVMGCLLLSFLLPAIAPSKQ